MSIFLIFHHLTGVNTLDTGHKLNVQKTRRGRAERLLIVLRVQGEFVMRKLVAELQRTSKLFLFLPLAVKSLYDYLNEDSFRFFR